MPSKLNVRKKSRASAVKIKKVSRNAVLWQLRLYIAGQTARSSSAMNNLKVICEEHLKGIYEIEVIDLIEKPQLAKGDQIFAIPTLVRKLPTPIKKIIGDLSNKEQVLVGLNIKSLKKT